MLVYRPVRPYGLCASMYSSVCVMLAMKGCRHTCASFTCFVQELHACMRLCANGDGRMSPCLCIVPCFMRVHVYICLCDARDEGMPPYMCVFDLFRARVACMHATVC